MTPGHNRLAALIADFEEARAERERRAAARRRAEAARPRAGRTDGFARWDAAVFSNAAPDAEREALRAASIAAAEAEMDFAEAEEALPFPAEEMGLDAPAW